MSNPWTPAGVFAKFVSTRASPIATPLVQKKQLMDAKNLQMFRETPPPPTKLSLDRLSQLAEGGETGPMPSEYRKMNAALKRRMTGKQAGKVVEPAVVPLGISHPQPGPPGGKKETLTDIEIAHRYKQLPQIMTEASNTF